MKIIRLEAENFKRISAVTIEPDGSLIVLGGKNGAGKSSTLDAIQAALGGAKMSPKEPIRRGASGAKVVVETEDYIVTRRWSQTGGGLEVKSRDGSKIPGGPQKFLDSVIGGLSFDPEAFKSTDPKKQADLWRKLSGEDFTAHDASRATLYDQRGDIGKEGKRLAALLESMPESSPETPVKEVSVVDLVEDLKAANLANGRINDHAKMINGLRGEVSGATALVADATLALAEAREDLLTAQADIDSAALKPAEEPRDIDAIQASITAADSINVMVRAKLERVKLGTDLDSSRQGYRDHTAKIAAMDDAKAKIISEAKYPVDGIGIRDDGVTLNGLPFEQASHAEQLRASVAIGLALNPTLRLILIRAGSMLDADGLKIIAEMAEAADAQVWMERVGDGDEVTVLIEDGMVAP